MRSAAGVGTVIFHAYASGSKANAYALEAAGRHLLIEAGLTWKRYRRALGWRLDQADGLLVSHRHGDHAKCAGKVAGLCVDVFASRETLEAAGLTRHPFGRELTDRKHVDIYCNGHFHGNREPWRVLPFAVEHDEDCPGTMGFLIEGPDGETCLFATDAGYLPVSAEVDILAIECSWSQEHLEAAGTHPRHKGRVIRAHHSVERLEEMLSRPEWSGLREVWLLHISQQHGNAEEFRDRIRAKIGRPVYIAANKSE